MSRFEEIKKHRRKIEEDEKAKSSSSTPKANSKFAQIKGERVKNRIGLDTLQSDLSSMGTTIGDIYNGWQNPETMKNARSSIESMQRRLNAYQEYQKIYGGADLSDIAKGYGDLLTDFDDRTKTYGKYKSADEYDNAMKQAKAEMERRASMPSTNLDEIQAEIDKLKGIEEGAKPLLSEVQKYRNQINASKSASGRNGYVYDPKKSKAEEYLKSAEEKLNQYYSGNGYANAEELTKAISEKSQYKNEAEWVQKGINMSSVGDVNSPNYDKEFDKKSKYVPTGKEFLGERVWTDNTYEYINDVNGSRELALGVTTDGNGGSYLQEVGYEYMTEQEKKTYNYYYQQGGSKRAEEYLNTIKQDLGARKAYADFEKYEGKTAKELLFSIRAGLDQFGTGMGSLFNGSDEYIPVNATQQLSGMIREDLDEVGFDNFLGLGSSLGQAVYDLGTTTANMAPSILASSVSNMILPGSGAIVGGATMGMSAAGNAYQEKLNQGWDKDQARVYSTAIGISEGALQYALGGISSMGGKLSGESIKAMATGIDNGLARFFATMGIKGMSEGIEESLQEIITPFIENLALGYEKNDWSDVELAEVAYAGILGALSAGLLEGGGTAVTVYKENSSAKGLGATVRNAERMPDAFNMASLTPQESDAYNLYTQYAKKGVNAENASDLQLGRLVYNTNNATQEVLASKKATLSERENAIDIQKKLGEISEENAIDKKTIGNIEESINTSKEYRDGLIETGLESADNTESHKLALELQEKVKNGEEISRKELSRLVKANDNAIKLEEYAQAMSEEDAGVFVEQYDGEMDVEEYHTNFTYVNTLADNAVDVSEALEKVSALTPSQVGAIYNAKILASDAKPLQVALDNLKAKHKGSPFIEGSVNDVVIDYRNGTTDGSKVNWKDLTARQKKAIRFAKAFAKATGVNIMFTRSKVVDGVHKGENGSYDPDKNLIMLDVYAGRIDASTTKDAIIPTLSHELTHWMKAKAPAIYKAISDDVMQTLSASKGLSRHELIAAEMDRIKKKHPEIKVTSEYAMDELVARGCEDMLKYSNQARKLLGKMSVEEQQTFKEKVKETFENLINWVNELLNYYNSESKEAKTLRAYKKDLKAISKMWDEMLVSAIESNQALQKEGKTGEQLAKADADVQYAIREEFANEIGAWEKDGKPDGESFILGTTGDVLQGLGAIESDIYMLGDKIKEILNDHPEITIDEIKKIPQILDDPVMVIKSKQIKSRLVMFGSVKAQNGKPILVVLDLRPYEKGFMLNDMQKVNSAYTKTETFNKTSEENGRDFVKNSEILYVDKKRTTYLLSAIGFYMPITCNQSGYIGSITYEGDNVNISGEEFSKVFKESAVQNSDRDNLGNTLSEGQAEYFKDSKVRDENGNLLVMYRGDSSEFTVFDRKKSKYSNLYGRGFYFTASKAHAGQYGNTREFYLDIKNPLIQKQNNITKKQMLNFLKAIENDGEDYDLYNYGQDATAESVLKSVWGKGDYEMLQDISAGAIGDLVAAIELFNEVNGTSYDGIILPTETITFKSEQAKLTSNKAPTDNEDIRFSMRENVEETKELVAVHNMRVSELERTLDLGGLPMPSIAIIKAKSGHSEYGDVSLVFPKSTIDPKASKLNKVYGGDAWTPTYPTIEYKPNAKVSKKINDKYYELSRKFGFDESRPLYNYVYDLEEQLNRNKGEAELLEGLYEDQNLMQLYLLDSGKSKVETIQKEIRTELTDAEVEMHEFFIKELGAEVIDGIVWDGNGTPMSFRKNYLSKYEDAIRNAYKKLLTEEYHFTDEQVQNVLDSTKASNLIQFMRDANKYRQNGRVTTRTEADYEATKQAIKDASADGYREWVDSLFKGVEEKSGIRNNADYFTNSGNRRSWEALHWENNLENVVRVMKSQDNGVAALFSGHAIWAVSAKDYRTVEEMKADADRLQRLSEEEYSEIKQGFGRRFEEIAQSIMSKSESNPFIAADNAMSCIVEAVRNSKTKSGLLNNLREYSQLTVTESTVDDIISLVADISNMPTEYFEAKPRRAVELNEIATAIIPDNTSDATKTRLDEMGIKYIEYENGNEESRLNALNSLEELKFSDRMTESVYDRMGEAENLRKDNERLTKDLGKLKERLSIEGKVTGGTAVLTKDTDLIAGRIRKLADSTYDKDALSNELKEFYTYMRESSLKGTWNEDAIFAKAKELAENVLGESKPKTVTNDYAKFLLREIRGKRISLSETQVQEAKNAFGKDWRNAFWGKVTIANNGISLDSQWQEWHSLYPEFFEADVNEGDQITALLELYNDLRDVSEVVQEYNAEEQTRWLAEEILDKCWELPVRFTIADKYDARIKVLKFEHRQAMKEMREEYEKRLEAQGLEIRWLAEKDKHELRKGKETEISNQKLADDIYYGRKINKLETEYEVLKDKKRNAIEMYRRIRDRKDAEIAEAKKLGKERLDEYKENAERKTVMQSMMSTVMSLNKKLKTNSKDVHIPETLKPVVINLLNAIDFSSRQLLGMNKTQPNKQGTPTKFDIATENALSKVHSMSSGDVSVSSLRSAIQKALDLFESAEDVLNGVSDGSVDSSVVALDAQMVEKIKGIIEELDVLVDMGETKLVMQKMSTDNLKTLNEMVKSINHWAVVADKALANKNKKRISELCMKTVAENDMLGTRQEYIKAIEDFKNFFNWSNLLPVNAFKRLGKSAMEFFDSLRDSQDTVTFNRQEIMDFTDKLLKEHKITDWRNDVREFKLKLPNGKEKSVKMPISYIMSLYCVSKQEDAKRHMYGTDKDGNKMTYKDEKGKVHDGGGITIKGFKDGKITIKVFKDLKNTIVNENIVNQITSVLTKEQRDVADALQAYMNTKGSEWGDAVSMALYGIKKFGVKDYFPITVSPHTIDSDITKGSRTSMFAIINYGFTKERNPKANQSIEIGDIFDVFANHMNMLAIYNAYALSVYDIARWYNFKGKTENGNEISVKTSIETAFGEGAITYVSNLIKDLNGQHESSRLGFIANIFKNTKVAMVGNSLSVALLQPTAYLKAMVNIPPKYLLKSAIYIRDFGAKKGVEKAKKYCGIALLKSQGYFETGVSAKTTTKLIHDESVGEKITEWSLKGAEWMDEHTWGVLWNACEFEVRATRKDLRVGSQEFYEVVGKKLRDVIYETQVVDSPLTKSDLMRSPDTGAKMITMFASEMTVAYNMVFESAYTTHLDAVRYSSQYFAENEAEYIQKYGEKNYEKHLKKQADKEGSKKARKENWKNTAMTLTAYTLTSAANAILTSAIEAFRYKEDEEKELEEYIKQYWVNFLTDWLIVGKIPYFKEALSMAQGYESSRTDTLWLQSAFKAYEYWCKAADGKDGATMKAIDNTLKSISYVSGVAVYNQWRELRAILRMVGIME